LRRVLPILFIAVFCFNTIGYYGLYFYIKDSFRREMSRSFDMDEYPGSECLIVKVPLSIPYPVHFGGYQRVDGEFESNGELYTLIKHRLVGDTSYVLMIKSSSLNKWHKSFLDFTNKNADSPLAKSTLKLLELAKDYLGSTNEIGHSSVGWYREFHFDMYGHQLVSFPNPVSSPPPEQFL